MDGEDYKARLLNVKKALAKIDRRVSHFGPADVTLEDKDTYKEYLNETRRLLDEAQEIAFNLIAELDIDSVEDGNRIAEIETLDNAASDKFKRNARDVKNKMLELLADYETSRPTADVEAQNLQFTRDKVQKEAEKEAKIAQQNKLKVELKMKNATKKSQDLKKKINPVLSKDCETMSDQEIRENLLNSKNWEKEVEALTTSKEAIELDAIGIDVDPDTKNDFQDEFHDAIDKVCILVENLKLIDKEKSLHTLAPSKVKENIVYPKPFSGETGENIFKFVKDFKDAIDADQVREVDKVKKLIALLKGEAKTAVGDHYKDLDSALEELKDSFGNEHVIWDKIQTKIQDQLGNREKWGKPYSSQRQGAVNKFFDFLRQAQNLAEEHPELERVVYSRHTMSLIRGVIPFEYDREFIRSVGGLNPSFKVSFQKMMGFLEEIKIGIHYSMKTSIEGKKEKETKDTAEKGDKRGGGKPYSPNKVNYQKDKHDCRNSKECKAEWDILGCVEIYKLAKWHERNDFCIQYQACLKCGEKFAFKKSPGQKIRHTCNWSNKNAARCNGKLTDGNDCCNGAVLCNFHPKNAKPEL